MIRWVGVGVGRREGQTGCKGFCAGGDGLDGGDSYADRFYTVLFPFFPLHVFALCLLLYFGGSLTIFYVSYKK
jgi:hypothetical protein